MTFLESHIKGVFEIKANAHLDERGGFARVYCKTEFAKAGLGYFEPVQANLSWNHAVHTLRGLHYQNPPFAEAKLVRAVAGKAFDVVVDLRETSETYLKWASFELDASARNAVFIPEGCAHGFLTLEPDTEILYQMGRIFEPGHDRGYRWNDPALAIDWPSPPEVIGQRDAAYPFIEETS